jgi:type IV pilus assembly protein PilA
MNKNSKGFSLLELLIVVAIILIIATIAIPSLLRSRQAANESAAVANLRTINTSQITYLSSSGGSYGDITMLVSDGLLGSHFDAANPVSGYIYDIQTDFANYTATATPQSSNNGRFAYRTGPDGVIRYVSGPGVVDGQPVQ